MYSQSRREFSRVIDTRVFRSNHKKEDVYKEATDEMEEYGTYYRAMV